MRCKNHCQMTIHKTFCSISAGLRENRIFFLCTCTQNLAQEKCSQLTMTKLFLEQKKVKVPIWKVERTSQNFFPPPRSRGKVLLVKSCDDLFINIFSRPLFTIIFKPKMVISRVKILVHLF